MIESNYNRLNYFQSYDSFLTFILIALSQCSENPS